MVGDVRIKVLGPLEVTVDGSPVTVRGRWWVVLAADEVVPVRRLVGYLWPDECWSGGWTSTWPTGGTAGSWPSCVR